MRIRCRGQLAIETRAVFLTPQPAGSWSEAALTTSDFIQFVSGGEGHFTWSALDASLFLGITISFVVQALSPPDPPHPPKQLQRRDSLPAEQHRVQRIYF